MLFFTKPFRKIFHIITTIGYISSIIILITFILSLIALYFIDPHDPDPIGYIVLVLFTIWSIPSMLITQCFYVTGILSYHTEFETIVMINIVYHLIIICAKREYSKMLNEFKKNYELPIKVKYE